MGDKLLLDSYQVKRPPHPRNYANIFEIVTFSWLVNLFKTGLKRDLDENDLYSPLKEHTSSLLGNELEMKWREEQYISLTLNRRPSLLRVLIRMFGCKYMIYGFLIAINELVIKMVQPLCIGKLLSYFSSDSSNRMDLREIYVWAFVFLLSISITSALFHLVSFEILHCGMKMRVACCSVIYRKALCLGHTALGETTVGQVINLISNDANRFDTTLPGIQYLVIGPVQTVMITYLVWREIGISSLIGVSTLLIFIPIQGWFGKKISGYRLKTANLTDERVCLMNEIISGIQVIKMYTWEKPFEKLIEKVRRKEIKQIRGSSIIRTISLSFIDFQTKLQVFFMVVAYVLLGNDITAEKVYVVTSYYTLLRFTMGLFFSQAPGQLAELLVSIKRIQNFLMHVEKTNPKWRYSNAANGAHVQRSAENGNDTREGAQPLNGNGVVLSNVTAKWAADQTYNTLDNINLTAEPGGLVAVIGSVGAGKSSLLQAILSELPLCDGTVSTRGTVSYCSQDPWLFSGSVSENILFNSPMDKQRYKQVIKACALNDDLKRFPFGDRTIVGERGVTLSGGQRARINLARAIYKQADIYLLDDPLSAVDTRVGKHLFENCINGYLKEKTCILVTHQIQFLTNVNQIVLMENASIKSTGSYRELRDSGYDFSNLLGLSKETIVESRIVSNNANKNCSEPNAILSRSDESIVLSIEGNIEKPTETGETYFSGRVSANVYTSYYSSCGSMFISIFVLCIFTLSQVLTTSGDMWLSFWVNEQEDIFRKENKTIPPPNGTLTVHDLDIPLDMQSNIFSNRLVVYTVLTVSMVLAAVMRSNLFVSACTSASINLHNKMFHAITRATMHFFNTNSSGRILNRFSKDIGAIDESLPLVFFSCLQVVAACSGIVFIVGLVNIYLIIPSIVLAVVCSYFRTIYLPTSRSVKRLEGITRSPVYGHMTSSIQGLTTIRAHKTEKIQTNEFDKYQDLHSSAWYMFIALNEGFGVWLDSVCLLYMSIVTLSLLYMDRHINGGNFGLTLTQIITLTGMIQWGIRQTAVLENEMNSVERVVEYTNTPQEAKLESAPDKTPPKEWPHQGKIVFLNFNLRYSQDTPYVLKNLNVTIRPTEKIGIVGRTGAGKSSIIAALFRLAFNEGDIFIDEIDIHSLGLHELRSKISIIPQEPVLFSGTMRTNLDPFDEYPDHVLWDALDKMELKNTIENLPGSLNTKMSESGSNFSVGQRQLVCLARAIIRKNKILVLDEATANVDPQTDALIQNAIRVYFETCTVLTIAHRLNTIMDSDKIIVMDAGRIVEFDHSHDLLKNEDGYFYKMVEQAGRSTADLLKRTAAESYKSTMSRL